MKRGRSLSKGFTIVEVMIFLAVSSILLISALTVVSGAQNKTEFVQAVNDLTQQINDTVSNVATGYYSNASATGSLTGQFTCTVSGGNIAFTAGASAQGGNQACVFLGRAIQFTDGQNFFVYNAVAKRQTVVSGKTIPATTYAQAAPRFITAIGNSFPETTETRILKNGIRARTLKTSSTNASGVAFLSSLGALDSTGDGLTSGSQTINYVPIVGSLTSLQGSFVNQFQSTQDLEATKNPASGLELCVNSGGTQQHAVITIGGGGRQDSVRSKINEGLCP